MDREEFVEKLKEESNKDIVKKYVLLLLASLENDPIRTKTKLMKEIFFISKNNEKLEDKSDFKPDNYGPNSDYVNNVLDDFKIMGVIREKNNRFFLSSLGEEIAKSLTETLDVNQKILINDMKTLFKDLTYDETIALVYANYPDMTVESLVKDKIGRKKIDLALNLFKKGKISSSKASEIASMSLREFYNFLNDKNIKVELSY